MKIHYSIVAGIALMIGCVMSGCKRDCKVSYIPPPNMDSLLILEHIKAKYPDAYNELMEENRRQKIKEIPKYGLMKLFWSKEIRPGIQLKFYLIIKPYITHAYILEKGKEKVVIEPIFLYGKTGTPDILDGTAFEGLLPEILIRDEFIAVKLGSTNCVYHGPKELHISPNYFLNLRNLEIIKDIDDLKRFENCLRDTTVNLPINWPDTTEALRMGHQWVDTLSTIEKINIRAKAIAAQQRTNKEFQTNMRYAIRRARIEGIEILPEIKKNYNNPDYIYYYQLSDLAVYEISLQRKKSRNYSVKTLVPGYLRNYYFTI